MRRNLKALGLALFAVFALGAVASSAASATEATFTSGSDWTILSAEAKSEQIFNANGEEVKCSLVNVDNATMGKDQNTITATPTYGVTEPDESNAETAAQSKCTIATLRATVHTQGCDYRFTAGGKTTGSVHILNDGATTCEIKITAYILNKFRPCIVVHDQTPTLPTVEYKNETVGSVWDVKVVSKVEGITYEKVGLCGSEESNKAVYTGEVTVKGKDTAGNPVNVTWDPET